MIELLIILYAATTFTVTVFLVGGIIGGYRNFFWCVVFLVLSPITLICLFSRRLNK